MTFSHFKSHKYRTLQWLQSDSSPKDKGVITPLFQTCMTFCVLMNSEEDILKNVKAQTAL